MMAFSFVGRADENRFGSTTNCPGAHLVGRRSPQGDRRSLGSSILGLGGSRMRREPTTFPPHPLNKKATSVVAFCLWRLNRQLDDICDCM